MRKNKTERRKAENAASGCKATRPPPEGKREWRKVSSCRVVGRSNNNANANGGLAYANANNASSNSNSNNGSRLANNAKRRKPYVEAAEAHGMRESGRRIAPLAGLHGVQGEAKGERPEPQQKRSVEMPSGKLKNRREQVETGRAEIGFEGVGLATLKAKGIRRGLKSATRNKLNRTNQNNRSGLNNQRNKGR